LLNQIAGILKVGHIENGEVYLDGDQANNLGRQLDDRAEYEIHLEAQGDNSAEHKHLH
jgi:hypothetical protein